MALTPTDLPEPVVPATSKCGIFARSATKGRAANVFAEDKRERGFGVLEHGAGEHIAQPDHFAFAVRQLDAHRIAAGHDGNPRGLRAHVTGNVVGEINDALGLHARGRFKFKEGHNGAGADLAHVAVHAVIAHDFMELFRGAAELRLRREWCCAAAGF